MTIGYVNRRVLPGLSLAVDGLFVAAGCAGGPASPSADQTAGAPSSSGATVSASPSSAAPVGAASPPLKPAQGACTLLTDDELKGLMGVQVMRKLSMYGDSRCMWSGSPASVTVASIPADIVVETFPNLIRQYETSARFKGDPRLAALREALAQAQSDGKATPEEGCRLAGLSLELQGAPAGTTTWVITDPADPSTATGLTCSGGRETMLKVTARSVRQPGMVDQLREILRAAHQRALG